MDSFDSYLLRKLYKETARHHDKLAETEKLVDWTAFTPIIQPMYRNKTLSGGRPNIDPVVMMKLLVLQAWYDLSDPELERQDTSCCDWGREIIDNIVVDFNNISTIGEDKNTK